LFRRSATIVGSCGRWMTGSEFPMGLDCGLAPPTGWVGDESGASVNGAGISNGPSVSCVFEDPCFRSFMSGAHATRCAAPCADLRPKDLAAPRPIAEFPISRAGGEASIIQPIGLGFPADPRRSTVRYAGLVTGPAGAVPR